MHIWNNLINSAIVQWARYQYNGSFLYTHKSVFIFQKRFSMAPNRSSTLAVCTKILHFCIFIHQNWHFMGTYLSFMVIETVHLKNKNLTINYKPLLVEVTFLFHVNIYGICWLVLLLCRKLIHTAFILYFTVILNNSWNFIVSLTFQIVYWCLTFLEGF